MVNASSLPIALLPARDALALTTITIRPAQSTVALVATRPATSCPLCGTLAQRIHSQYQRTLADLLTRHPRGREAGWIIRTLAGPPPQAGLAATAGDHAPQGVLAGRRRRVREECGGRPSPHTSPRPSRKTAAKELIRRGESRAKAPSTAQWFSAAVPGTPHGVHDTPQVHLRPSSRSMPRAAPYQSVCAAVRISGVSS